MNRATACKILLLFILGLASFAVTSAIVRQPQTLAGTPKKARSASVVQEKPKHAEIVFRKGKVEEGRSEEDDDHVLGPLVGPELAYFSLYHMTVESKGRDVIVSAKADIQDKRKNIAYVWVIAVKERGTKKIVHQDTYKDQVFWLEGQKFAQPTFQEMLELKPGDYNVTLKLYEISRNFDFSKQLQQSGLVTSRTSQVKVEASK